MAVEAPDGALTYAELLAAARDAARGSSGVSVTSFQRGITVQWLTRDGLDAIGRDAMTIARAEGLEAHARAVAIRLEGAA